jgi:hypothetical protein
MAPSTASASDPSNLYIAAPDATVPIPHGTADQWRLVLIAPFPSARRADWLMVRNTWLMGSILFQLLQRLPPWPLDQLKQPVGYGTTHIAAMDKAGNVHLTWFSQTNRKS